MINVSRIPDDTKSIKLSEKDGTVTLDTKGLDCIVKTVGADIFIKAKENGADEDVFILRDGESISFCGRVGVFTKSTADVYCMFYRTL